MKIFIINGAAGSGKDTFVELCRKFTGDAFLLNISTVDKVKEIATACGWDGTKTPENRKFLSDLKALLTDWADVPLNDMIQKIERFKRGFEIYDISDDRAIVFIHCREPEEIRKLVKALNARTLLIRRSAAENITASNQSDAGVLDYEYDIHINNNGSLAELERTAEVFIKSTVNLI
jgi:hypothetical protein